ncbi:dipeptidase [Aestuariivirga litoralis]|uniref:dipeptidase n=1 Tax=Aestuariivirga litoralis TaxID=2650924 RepID=UPI001AED41D5|nr:dipeptidase [Aestuariivirga litoralis]
MQILDGHNDLLFRLWQKTPAAAVSEFIDGRPRGQLDLPRMHDGHFAGGMFAMFVPSNADQGHTYQTLNPPPYPPVDLETAQTAAEEQLEIFDALVTDVPNHGFRHCLTAADMRLAMSEGAIAAVLHMEGCEAIGPELEGLDELYARGLRSLGPVWSRNNVFGNGVPFAWPSSADHGGGLSEAGKALVAACNQKRIVVDLSHFNLKGFWDVAKLSNAPLIATHSNVHALCASSRNLTDDQLRAIGESKGMVGLNYAIDFLQNDGLMDRNIPPERLIRHLEHMIKIAGEDSVGLGSDFDGATIPDFIGDVAGLPHLVTAMEQAGFGTPLIEKLTHKNWLRVLELTWGA